MPAIQHEVVLNAPPERLWEFLTALRYHPLWMADVASVQAISTPETAAGTTYTVMRRGRHGPESWIVGELDPGRFLRLSEYRRDVHLRFRLEPLGEGTRLHVEYAWPSRGGLLDRLLPRAAQQRTLVRSLARLKELVALNQDIKLLYGMGDE